MKKQSIAELKETARLLRMDTVSMIHKAGDGHIGPSLSVADIVTALYFHVMNITPQNPHASERDRFILSKGHACPMLYAALAHRGYFDKSELPGLRSLSSMLQGHPDMIKTPGIDFTSGSLGNGLSIGLGMALAARIKKESFRTYVIVGDGEMAEGVLWEAILAAGHQKAAGLTAIIDNNGMQSGGSIRDITGLEPLHEKLQAFGWHVQTIDGHDYAQLLEAFQNAEANREQPSAIIAVTIKGKGVSFMMGDNSWHKRIITNDEYELAMKELGGSK